ncbi:MAG: twin-arginine translocase TatA/TatE family subunit [Myxococcaceae bacterium]|nr:twin-arginine translocase TatA/TatE family subunit [Myxococcaceae bacterium]
MLNVGAGEIALIMVVALLVLGPRRLPELARAIGKFMREFRRQTDEVRSTLEAEFYRMDQDFEREEPKSASGPTPIPHGADGNEELARILPPIAGPLDGGRRVADELNLDIARSKLGSAPPPAVTANAPPAEIPAAPAGDGAESAAPSPEAGAAAGKEQG